MSHTSSILGWQQEWIPAQNYGYSMHHAGSRAHDVPQDGGIPIHRPGGGAQDGVVDRLTIKTYNKEKNPNSMKLLVALVVALVMATAVTILDAQPSLADQGTNVDAITFIEYNNDQSALDAIRSDVIDIYNYPVPYDLAEELPAESVQLFDSTDGVRYTLLVNPAPTQSSSEFNPFAYREVRYALHFLVDRQDIVDTLLQGQGQILSTSIGPSNPDYLLIHRQLESLGIQYDPARADHMITSTLEAQGATKIDGKWFVDGNQITIKMFIRTDDPIRTSIGNALAEELEMQGFVIQKTGGNLQDAFAAVHGSNPTDFVWHIYTGAYSGPTVVKYDNVRLASYFAPWASNMPGRNHPTYWNYENQLLDQLTYRIYSEDYVSIQQRADLVRAASHEAVQEAVRIVLASGNNRHVANDGIDGIINVQASGIANRFTPINADSPNGNLTIGVKYITQGAWNPVLGLADVYSWNIWSILNDYASVRDPFTGDLTQARSTWNVETTGPDASMQVPATAIGWNPSSQQWEKIGPGSEAVSKVTFNFKFSNWHNGIPMDINDILYPIYFGTEWSTNNSTNPDDIQRYHNEISSAGSSTILGLNVVNDTAIEVYTNYWHFDDTEIVDQVIIWSSLPWEVYAAMESVVLSGDAVFSESDATEMNLPWLSLLESNDSGLIKMALEDFKVQGVVPAGLYNKVEAGASARYDASIDWITARDNAVISNGPFYLEGYSPDTMTLNVKAFDDPTYPLQAGYWNYLAADRDALKGEIVIGSVAPITGGASEYGADISEASKLAVVHFNEYLEERNASWYLSVDRRDSATNVVTAREQIESLNTANITLIDGQAIDYDGAQEIVDVANDNNMLLVSCCSVTTPLAQEDDSLFRLTPGHPHHGAKLASLMKNDGISMIVPVGADNIWITDLLEQSIDSFDGMSDGNATTSHEIIKFGYGNDRTEPVARLASVVQEQIDLYGADKVGVLYIGFERGVEFIRLASQHDVLGDVRWYTADMNTVRPNVVDDDVTLAFAEKVGFTSVQPTVIDNEITKIVREYITDKLDRAPSVYAHFEYDALWILALGILETQSTDAAAIKAVLPDIARQYFGASGNTLLNAAGDRVDANYAVWEIIDGKWTAVVPGTITGTAYIDINNNAVMDSGESGLSGITVNLQDASGDMMSATTDSNGAYMFSGVTPGTVLLQIVQYPPQHIPSDGTESYSYITLTNLRNPTVDFALFPITPSAAATVTGKVYSDTNANTIFDGQDMGLQAVEVYVVDSLTMTAMTGMTDQNGDYTITGVLPDSVLVQMVSIPAGHLPSAGQESYRNMDLKVGSVTHVDFVLTPVPESDMASIQGMVYQDNNANGVRDIREPGIQNARVYTYELLTMQAQTVFTDENGAYSITGILPDSVLIQHVPGHITTTPTIPEGGFSYLDLDAGQNVMINFANSGILSSPVDTLQASTSSDTRIDLSWSEPDMSPLSGEDDRLIGYKIEVESPLGTGFVPVTYNTETTQTWYYHTGLTPDTEYNYRISPITEAGVSSASNVAMATTEPTR